VRRSSKASENGGRKNEKRRTGRTSDSSAGTKRCDVLLHPLQSNTLVMQAKVEGTSPHRLGSLREAERAKTIVDRHVQDRCPLCVASINKRVNDL